MAEVFLRKKAIDDLNAIWEYTAEKWSLAQADEYYDAVRMACLEIGQDPGAGRKYEGVGNNLLGLRAGKHIIFYRVVSTDEIEVIRILHERMDLMKRVGE